MYHSQLQKMSRQSKLADEHLEMNRCLAMFSLYPRKREFESGLMTWIVVARLFVAARDANTLLRKVNECTFTLLGVEARRHDRGASPSITEPNLNASMYCTVTPGAAPAVKIYGTMHNR